MHYAHNVGLGAFIKICIFEHLYKISYKDIQIHLIMPCIKQETNVVKNDKEKRTKGLSDYVGEAKLKFFTPKDQFCE